MMNRSAAARYGKALVEVLAAGRTGVTPEQALDQLRMFEAAASTSPDLVSILESPSVPPARKRAVIGRIGEGQGMSVPVRNFLWVLVNRRRIAGFRDAIAAFQEALDAHLGIVPAELISARELNETQRGALAAKLETLTGKRVRLTCSVQAELIGGVIARVGSVVYDGSLRGQLESLKGRLQAG